MMYPSHPDEPSRLAFDDPYRRLPAGEPKFRRRAHSRQTEIAAAARDVFAEKGFGGATLALIAERAGLSRGGMARYFATKDAVWLAAAAVPDPQISSATGASFPLRPPAFRRDPMSPSSRPAEGGPIPKQTKGPLP